MIHSYVIVDDDPMFAMVLKKQLDKYSELSFVEHYKDSVSAVMGIKNKEPRIVFLDWNIDTFKGSDIIETLTTEPIVIVLSSDPEVKKANLPKQVIGFLEKPVTKEKKLERVIKLATGILNVNQLMAS